MASGPSQPSVRSGRAVESLQDGRESDRLRSQSVARGGVSSSPGSGAFPLVWPRLDEQLIFGTFRRPDSAAPGSHHGTKATSMPWVRIKLVGAPQARIEPGP
jgi:hypothetical protein